MSQTICYGARQAGWQTLHSPECEYTVYDILGWLAAGMSIVEIIDDFPELTETDIKACLEFAADRNHRIVASVGAV